MVGLIDHETRRDGGALCHECFRLFVPDTRGPSGRGCMGAAVSVCDIRRSLFLVRRGRSWSVSAASVAPHDCRYSGLPVVLGEAMTFELLALLTAFSYATSNIAARWGLRYSTPNTVVLFSLAMHAVGLSSVVLLTEGIPSVPHAAFYLVVITGVLQTILRSCHYLAISKVGVSRAVTLRNTHPMLTVLIGVTVLGEQTNALNLLGVVFIVGGTALTSWKMDEQITGFRRWYLILPIATSVITSTVHPIRRYAMLLADEPLFFAALVGIVAISCFTAYLALPLPRDPIVWHRKALLPFVVSGACETLAILLLFFALASGPTVIVSPITATSPVWTVLLASIVLRRIENTTPSVVFGTLLVVAGAICVTLGRHW